MSYLLPDTEDDLLLNLSDLISFKDAPISGGACAVRDLDRENLEHLQCSDPESWPPILVTRCTSGYLVIDGYHRWEVAKRRQLRAFKAICRAYQNENEVIEAAFRANLLHGLNASVETRGDYAYWLHITYPGMQQNDIARRVGITQGAVSKAIARWSNDARKALQHEETCNEEMQKKQMKKSCRHFTRVATHFLDDVQQLNDVELRAIFNTVMTREEQAKLARISRLLTNEDTLITWFRKK
jgi:ParB-like chromosome segregation protein Spo0J